MSARLHGGAAALILLALCLPTAVHAQSLTDRVASARGNRVEFTFATRGGVCGDGQSYIHIANARGNDVYGAFGDMAADACVHGPARVVLDRADGSVVGLRVFVGPPAASPNDATSLGAVPTRDAVAYLLNLAGSAQGALARDAILPAMLADSVDNDAALIALARDKSRARETRSTAISWLSRDADASSSAAETLVQIGTDDADNQSVRQQALFALARLGNARGIADLMKLADDAQGGWTARTALGALAQSGDPRSRDYLRGLVSRAALPDQALAVAVRGLGQQYATAADIRTIRDSWSRFTGERTQSAAIIAISQFGGADNTAWLLALGKDMGTTSSIRQRAIESAIRSGAQTADLVHEYQQLTDPDVKRAIISALGQIDDRAAVDELLAIARGDESVAARRSAVNVLGRSSDPRVKDALAGIVVGR